MKLTQEKLIKIIKEEQETIQRMRETEDPEGEMAGKQAEMAAKHAAKIAQMVNNMDELEDWVQAKLTLATDYLQTVSEYLEFSDVVKRHIGKNEEE
jgi:hypothetical protein